MSPTGRRSSPELAQVVERNIQALIQHRREQEGSRSGQERVADAITVGEGGAGVAVRGAGGVAVGGTLVRVAGGVVGVAGAAIGVAVTAVASPVCWRKVISSSVRA